MREDFEIQRTRNLKAAQATAAAADFDTFRFEKTESNNLIATTHKGNYNSTGRHYSAYMASFSASSFSFLPAAQDGCSKLEHVKTMAKDDWHTPCAYATNGGFFHMMKDGPVDGSFCVGNIISDGQTIQLLETTASHAEIGITSDGRLLLGMIAGYDDLPLTQLMQGMGWLVRSGKSYVNSTSDIAQPAISQQFVTEKAPRTAVGVLTDGSMALLQVDGVEDLNKGPDLFEMAELAVDLGFQSLVNIDGGGSSVSVHDGKVIDWPTCDDTGRKCERMDANIACVH